MGKTTRSQLGSPLPPCRLYMHPASEDPPKQPSTNQTAGEPDTVRLRYVDVRGARYLRVEDVQAYIISLGSSEETDVRNRLTQAAGNLAKAHRPALLGSIPR